MDHRNVRRPPFPEVRWLWTLAAIATVVWSCATDTVSETPSVLGPFDASLDAGHEDGSLDAIDAREDPPVADSAEAGPYPHCQPTGALPSWAEERTTENHLVAHCAGFDLVIAALDDGILRLRYAQSGQNVASPTFAVEVPIARDEAAVVGGRDERALVCTEWMRVEVREGCLLEITDSEGAVLVEDGNQGGWRTAMEDLDGVAVQSVNVRRATPIEELFYGFGEKTGPLQKRGRRMVFWNTDAYDGAHGGFPPSADPLYQSIPFFIGLRENKAYGVFTDNSHRVEIDIAAASPSQYEVKAFGGVLEQNIFAGPLMADVVKRYARLTGRMPLPARWTLGYHQCRWGYAPDSAFEEIGQQFRDRNIPADGLWLDIQHMDGFRSFTWDPQSFPDPSAMMARLEAQGFKTTVIVDPGIKVEPGWDVYDQGLAEGHFLRNPSGEPFVEVVWPGPASFPDFTAPQTRSWWGRHIGSLVNLGVRGIWLDVNEPTTFPEGGGGTIPSDVPVDGDGVPTTMAEAHNVYALHEARATSEGMLAQAPDRRPFVLSRAGFAGIQRYAAVWTGDAPSTFASLEETLPMLLNMGLSGVSFVGSDVGGYSGNATPELFARWMALGSISPFFRGHVTHSVNDQEPWAFGTEVEDISRSLIQLRYQLLPYLYSLFLHSVETGEPVLRPMVYQFQHDPVQRSIGDQAMLGPYLLFAPVLHEGAQVRTVSLPPGRWFEFHSGAIHTGPAVLTVPITLAALPTYVAEGAIIPRSQTMQWTDQEPINPLRLDLYPSPAPSSFTFYEDDGDGFEDQRSARYARTLFTLQQTASGARLVASAREGSYVAPPRTLLLRVRRVDHGPTGVELSGNAIPERSSFDELLQSGHGWWYDGRDLSLAIAIADQDDFELLLTYDPTVLEPAPPVDVAFEVTLPAGTPMATMIHIASSPTGWAQLPLSWGPGPNMASGTVTLPRGEWFTYKYTRGDWDTVEKWPGCEEAEDRYGLAAAHPTRRDTVFTWRDWCP